jgi:hypothetical protein
MSRKKLFNDDDLVKITVRIWKTQKEKIEKHRRKTLKGQDEQVREALDEYFKRKEERK